MLDICLRPMNDLLQEETISSQRLAPPSVGSNTYTVAPWESSPVTRVIDDQDYFLRKYFIRCSLILLKLK